MTKVFIFVSGLTGLALAVDFDDLVVALLLVAINTPWLPCVDLRLRLRANRTKFQHARERGA